MQWDVGTVAFTIELHGRKVINAAALQRFYGMLSIRFPDENNGKRRGVFAWVFPTGNLANKWRSGFVNSVFQSIH